MEEKQPASSPEIDLAYFFQPLKRGLKTIRKWINNYYFRITNNGLLFLALLF